uniref:Coiled-coil domain containing 74A n=1 Tax=Chelydra serpentina TaxID=8475 RepID=A0A8C3THB5_CHESE
MYNTSLPPLGNLPQWSRVGLDKSNHLQLGILNNQGPQPHSQAVEVWNKDSHKLVMDLERSLKFLQQEHAETLMKLHEEIEYLKRENKELHYKLIMNQQLQVKGRLSIYLVILLFLNCDQFSREDGEVSDKITSPVLSLPSQIKSGQAQVPPASSNPFLVNVLPSHIRKPPTLEECENVIHQLWNINHMQAQELTYLKSYLEDIHKNKRIPEDYLESDLKSSHCQSFLSPTLISSLIITPLPAAERAVLPALKQTLGNSFAERQKRTQAIQRSRLRRTVL